MSSFIAWLLLGMIAGFVGSKAVNRSGHGLLLDIFLGITGAATGGFLSQSIGQGAKTGLDFWNLLIAATGALLLLTGYHTIRRSGSVAP
jgi:uncharacterized membrane protein YeaQ/YmgE (transglycosylase-associated protein family)